MLTFAIMQLRSAGYHISFENRDFEYLTRFLHRTAFSQVLILCDSNSRKYCLPLLLRQAKQLRKSPVHVVPAGERHKTLASAQGCWDFLLKHAADRSSLLVCLGGGVICDLGGFAASTFKRGLAFVHVPTTLLAMADASVGGKTGIDYRGYKNLIGTITQPQGVFIEQAFLRTLHRRHIYNGMAEVIKSALIGDKRLWHRLLMVHALDKADLDYLVHAAVKVKNKIVTDDPLENNIRKALNFGHTVGHAIESYFLKRSNSLLHGEAIVMGMCVELCLGKQLNHTYPAAAMEVFLFFRKHYALRRFTRAEIEACLKLMQQDKKNRNGRLNFTLIEKPGTAWIDMTASAREVRDAFGLYNNLLMEPAGT